MLFVSKNFGSAKHSPPLPTVKLSALNIHCLSAGSLVLGQNQECYGGCFNPQSSLKGDLADVRIWSKALMQVGTPDQCKQAML